MRLLNILLPVKYKFVLLLMAIAVAFASVTPLIIVGKEATFFTIDPDVVYFANALSFFKTHTIVYNDHPGILSIFLISLILLPVKLATMAIPNVGFIDFVYDNFLNIFQYTRFVFFFIFVLGLFTYFNAVLRYSKSILSVFLAALLLLNFLPVYYLGLSVSAETLSFLLASLWCLLFIFKDHKRNIYSSLFFVFSGLIFANRATAIFYLFAACLIAFEYKDKVRSYSLILFGFLLGILPSIGNIFIILKRVFFFGMASDLHGGGSGKLLNIELYVNSLKTFLLRDPVYSYSIIFIVVFVFLYRRKTRKDIIILTLLFFFGTLLFAKFPLAHYQIANYQLLIFIFTGIYSQFSNKIKILILIPLLYCGLKTFNNYKIALVSEMQEVVVFEKFVKTNIAQGATFYDWARSEDFAKLWVNSYSSGLFDGQLQKLKIYLYTPKLDLPSFCGDILYLQESTLVNSDLQKEDFEIKKINGSQDLYQLKAKNCF